ncbi:hypothetical protein WICANDRAFT_79821 [Wickerhamomyces anomalus NRRL Y-366-8]|uniref:Uncharacterized protein n=1 Tax=Wickerhamomyces anomalus (strain ATCC 58044 / CBS 1984 / NCYC 433 / NRRL Y-366-8) TaxID=683960 RepID=A0A1E3P1T5_WICAA|nr:uncharacterized protein WICANDRAFT_79821 [Wickerhamomyces anomalus NRRL Y-366-8]ODQ59303.1 hypothetical protein WICANDRAFT_79821 [Wickerhamomyces anomalus NRRL Y-366-8]
MTFDKKYDLLIQIQNSINNNTKETTDELLKQLKIKSRDELFLSKFPASKLDELIIIFTKLNTQHEQLIVISTICNVLLVNDDLRMNEPSEILTKSVPKLEFLLDYVSERDINSESQYNDFLPIFRLYYLLSYNPKLLPLLKESVYKISGKLLNFITLSTSDSKSLNKIIIEILKIIYSFVHQGEDSSGLDSVFVLSCNKFNLIYSKLNQTSDHTDYDEILQHFGNILITISIEVSKHYMLNKKQFAINEINYLNGLSRNDQFGLNTPTSNLLTLDVLLTIDTDDTEVKQILKEQLNLEHLETLGSEDMNLTAVVAEIRKKIDEQSFDFSNVQKQHQEDQIRQDKEKQEDRFEDLSNEEKEEELNKIAEIFDRIEKNGMLKVQTR